MTPDTAAAQIVQLLATLDVSAISTHQDLRTAVLDLIERSAKEFRDEVVQRIDSNKRRRKNTSKYTPEEAQLFSHLAEHDYSVTASSKQVVERLARAAKGLQSSLHIKTDAFQIPNDKAVGHLSHTISFVGTAGCRQARIMQHYKMCAQATHVTEGWRRLYMLWVIYEVDRLMSISERTGPEKSDVAYAEREFCRLSGESMEVIREIRTVSRSYVTAANRGDGLGIILMLGSQTKDAWERGRTLDDDAVSWLWASCIAKHSQLEAKAKALQRVACAVIRQGFLEYDIEPAELLEEGHVFTRHFRAEEASRDSPTRTPTRLQVLAAAANQVESSRPGSTTSGVAQDRSARDAQAQQQLRARNEDSGACNQAAMPCMNESGSGTTTNAFEACGLSTAGAQIHTSTPGEMPIVPIGIYEQTRKSQWELNALDSWSQQVAAPATPCISRNSVQRCPQSGLGNVDVAMEEQSLQSQWCLPGDLSERRDTMISNLPLYDSPDQADQNLAADRDLATEDWNEAMQHALTQFEDGTTDEWDRATRDALAQFGDFFSTT